MTNPVSNIVCEPVLFSYMQLHGSVFSPHGKATAAVLIIPPLFEEKRCAHRAMVCSARKLAGEGAIVLHVDLYATGNSQGSLQEIGLDRWMDDLIAGHSFLCKRSGEIPVTILGCRAGALLAAQAIANGMSASRFLLCQPVVDGRDYLKQLHTRRMIQHKMTGEALPETVPDEVEGQILSSCLYTGLQKLQLPSEMPAISLRLLQCSFNDNLIGDYAKILDRWGKENVHVRRIISEPFWNPHSPGEYENLAQAVTGEVFE